LNVELPQELRELLAETNGASDDFGIELIWPTDRIIEDNIMFRTCEDFAELYMPFDALLFFSNSTDGDQFAYAIKKGVIRDLDIYRWNHEDDSRSWAASNLTHFIEEWDSKNSL
jgi:hypothetical protein